MAHKLWATRGMTLAEKLSFYSMPEPNSGCVLWCGHANTQGYGMLRWNGRERPAHRLAWEVVNGPTPDGKFVLHRCDNPGCVNPAHLRTGTQTDNMRDMYAKGRQPNMKGEVQGNAKLTAEKVRQIRIATEPQTAIAARFGVSQQLVSRIRARGSWPHVT